MSYMTELEIHAREAVALSLLNKLRRYAAKNITPVWDTGEKNIILEALNFSKEKTVTKQMFLYSFRGLGENNEAAALQLSEALTAALSAEKDSEIYINAMRSLIENSGTEEEKKLVSKLTSSAMDAISIADLASSRNKNKFGTGL